MAAHPVDGVAVAKVLNEEFCKSMRDIGAVLGKPLTMTRLTTRLAPEAIDRELLLHFVPVVEPVDNVRSAYAARPPSAKPRGRLTLPDLGTWVMPDGDIIEGATLPRFVDQPTLLRASLYDVDGVRQDVAASQIGAVDAMLRDRKSGGNVWPQGLVLSKADPPWQAPVSDPWLDEGMVGDDLDGGACRSGRSPRLPKSPLLLLLSLAILLAWRQWFDRKSAL